MADKLRFGTGGIPHTTKPRDLANGIKRMAALGLEHLELEFVQSVFVTKDKAPSVAEVAKENNVTLSVHGSYYINLGTTDKKIWHASINRIVSAAEVGALCGAKSITYHSGFWQQAKSTEVIELVLEGMEKILTELREKKAKIRLSPELTGKPSQCGDLPTLILLAKKLKEKGFGFEEVGLCIDFSHNYARSNGGFNTYDEFMGMLDDIAGGLGPEYLEDLHIHISGIEYSEKGERNHLLFMPKLEEYTAAGIEVPGIEKEFEAMDAKRLEPNKFNWQELLKALKQRDVKGYVVCESPILELDALLMQRYYQQI